jgi:hypothetical protein
MSGKRDIMDGHHGGYAEAQGRGVARGEEDVEMVAFRHGWQADLLPPGAGRTGHQPRGEVAGVEAQVQTFGRIQDELMAAGPLVR